MHAEPLHTIYKQEYTKPVAAHLTLEAEGAWEVLKDAILSVTCIQKFNYRKLTVLRSDFSAQGFGFVLLQPGNNEASVQAALDYCDGKGFSFMTKDSKAI